MNKALNEIPRSAGTGDYTAISIYPYVFTVGAGRNKHAPRGTHEDAEKVQNAVESELRSVRQFDEDEPFELVHGFRQAQESTEREGGGVWSKCRDFHSAEPGTQN